MTDPLRDLTLLVLGSPEDRSLARLQEIPGVTAVIGGDAHELSTAPGALESAEVLLVAAARPDVLEEVLQRARGLRWLHTRSAGIDHLLCSSLATASYPVTNGRGAFSASLAEFALAGILHFAKDVPRLQRAHTARRWDRFEPEGLAGKTVGLVGYGDIGRAVARLARAFEMHVLAVRRTTGLADDPLGVRFLEGPGALLRLMSASDAVVIVAAHTPETRGLVSAEALAALRPSAVLVNVARGALVDEAALVHALRARRLRGAVLDVFSVEPLPPEHPLYELDNVLLSPHSADNIPGWLDDAVDVFLANLGRYRRGEPLQNQVSPGRGY